MAAKKQTPIAPSTPIAPTPPIDDAVRFNFRLNPRRPREKVILDFLRQHTEQYDASRVIKQALYELATNRSWLTGQPIVQFDPLPEAVPVVKPNEQLLNDIVSGLEDWLQQ